MKTRTCPRCKIDKSLDLFNKDKNRRTGVQTYCKECAKERFQIYYKNNKEHHLETVRKVNRANVLKKQKFVLKFLLENPCVQCREKDVLLLEFDHLRNKKFIIAELVCGGFSIKSLQKEMKKCQILCVACHRKKSMKNSKSYKYLYTIGKFSID